MKEEFNKGMKNLRKRINRNLRNKKLLKSNKNTVEIQFQQTRTRGRQNFRPQRQNRYQRKNRIILGQKIQEL
jgi:hypothetical protein